MTSSRDAKRLSPEAMAKHIPDAAGNRFHIGLKRGQLQVEIYIPEGADLQQPHSRDECYVVIRGSGRFQIGEEVIPFNAGDFLFVPAGMKHRFLDFGDNLVAWVIFYGPKGGECVE